MRITFHQIAMVVILCLTFIGQAFSYAPMSCDMKNDTHQMNMSSSVMSEQMDHSMMSSDMHMSSTSSYDDNCCDAECDCLASACTSISFVASANLSPKINSSVSKISFQVNLFNLSQYNVLYRPPIFA